MPERVYQVQWKRSVVLLSPATSPPSHPSFPSIFLPSVIRYRISPILLIPFSSTRGARSRDISATTLTSSRRSLKSQVSNEIFFFFCCKNNFVVCLKNENKVILILRVLIYLFYGYICCYVI